jgi:hypothetical protein
MITQIVEITRSGGRSGLAFSLRVNRLRLDMIATLHYFWTTFCFCRVNYGALKVSTGEGGWNYGADIAKNVSPLVLPALDEKKRGTERT